MELEEDTDEESAWWVIDDQVACCIKGWKHRTKDAPIELHIILQKELKMALIPPLLRHLAPTNLCRLTKLSLCRIRREDVIDLREGVFVSLQKLVLSFDDWDEENIRARPRAVRAFEKCPALRRVALDTLGVSSDASGNRHPLIVLPWSQLSHLVVFKPTPVDFFDQHMNNCPSLTLLYFSVDTAEANALNPSTRYTKWKWPSLVHLSIYLRSDSQGCFWVPRHIGHIDPKHLKTLRLLNGYGEVYLEYTEDEKAAFASWVRSIQSLKTLMIFDTVPYHTNYMDISEVVALTPDVERLELKLWFEDDGETLLKLTGRPELLPKLSTFIVQLAPGEETKEGIMAVVEERLASVDKPPLTTTGTSNAQPRARLEHLIIISEPDPGRERPEDRQCRDFRMSDDFRELQRFQDQGLVVEYVDVGRGIKGSKRGCGEKKQLARDWLWVERDEVLGEDWPELQDFFLVCGEGHRG